MARMKDESVFHLRSAIPLESYNRSDTLADNLL